MSMPIYSHKQAGTLILWLVGLSLALVAGIGMRLEEGLGIVVAVAGALSLTMFLFASLTVEVTGADVMLAFGPGLIRKRFPISEIVGARAVTNPWYYGWGIHLTPHGWLYNVSGREAVELDLKTGRKARIGTDEPSRLLAAITNAMSRRR